MLLAAPSRLPGDVGIEPLALEPAVAPAATPLPLLSSRVLPQGCQACSRDRREGTTARACYPPAEPEAIKEGLKRGEKVAISGIGIFETAHRGPRKGRNIHTGEAIEVAPMTLVKFRPGKGLKDAVNPGSRSGELDAHTS
jgi:nucleoid DNA-binding protein